MKNAVYPELPPMSQPSIPEGTIPIVGWEPPK